MSLILCFEISAVVDFQFDNKEGLDECLNYKDKKVFEYTKQKILKGLKKNMKYVY